MIIIITILSVFIYFSETGVSHLPSSELKAAKLIPAVKGDSIITITMSFVGDLMCHVPQMTNAKNPTGLMILTRALMKSNLSFPLPTSL